MDWGNEEGKKGDRKDRKQKQGLQIRMMRKGRRAAEKIGNRSQESLQEARGRQGDIHHHGSSMVRGSVVALQQRWAVGRCSVDEDSDHRDDDDDDDDGSTNLFISPKWLSQPLGMTVSGFWISARIPFVPISLALPADKREYRGTNLYLVFTGYSGVIPQSPIANRSYLVTGQIFCL